MADSKHLINICCLSACQTFTLANHVNTWVQGMGTRRGSVCTSEFPEIPLNSARLCPTSPPGEGGCGRIPRRPLAGWVEKGGRAELCSGPLGLTLGFGQVSPCLGALILCLVQRVSHLLLQNYTVSSLLGHFEIPK